MTMRERMTGGVVLVLAVVGAWYLWEVRARGGLAGTPGTSLFVAALAITVLTTLVAALVTLTGSRTVDERDRQVTLRAQVVRGYLYLGLGFGVLGIAYARGDGALAAGMFLAILGIEIASGLVMLGLYRRAA